MTEDSADTEEKKEKKKKKSSGKDGEKKVGKKSATGPTLSDLEDKSVTKGVDADMIESPQENVADNLKQQKRKSLKSHDDISLGTVSEEASAILATSITPVDPPPETQDGKSTMDIINEILNPPLMEFDPSKPYDVPIAVKAGDVNALQDLDERKIIELKEAFQLFDLDGDGCIDADDLKGTFGTLGEFEVPEGLIDQMLSEAMNPLDFDAFVMLLGYKTIELDPEDVLIEALSKWDPQKSGVIDEDKLRHDLTCYGDRFTDKEATYALEEAPIANKNRAPGETPLIDYQGFCKILSGLRKRKSAVANS